MPVYAESLDPGRPLVRCQWRSNDGEDHGHGVTLGTRSETEAETVLIARRDRRQMQAHERGSHAEKPSRVCPTCQAQTAA